MSLPWNKRNVKIIIEEMEETTDQKSSGDAFINVIGRGRQKIQGTAYAVPIVIWAGTALTFLTSEVKNTITAEKITAEKISVNWDGFALTALERSWS